jgi:acyl dehydratase
MTVPTAYDVVARNIDPSADNRIHDDDIARQYGFTGALVPGVELFAYCTSPLVQAWGEDWLRAGRLAVRFRRPVHDGERVTVAVEPSGEVALRGADGAVRTTGTAARTSPPPAAADIGTATLPAALRAAPEVGTWGTVTEPADPAARARYLDDVAEPAPLYRERGLVHPGLLLRLVNAALMRNVELGPWIHTASDCRFLSTASVDEDLAVRSAATEVFERNGHGYVRYDALVLAGERPVAAVHHEAIWRLRA